MVGEDSSGVHHDPHLSLPRRGRGALLSSPAGPLPRLLAYTVPVLMLFSLAWLAVVDFRFATSCWEGYHFWIPVVEYIWYIQYTIFPL